jgi:hypothetical protein
MEKISSFLIILAIVIIFGNCVHAEQIDAYNVDGEAIEDTYFGGVSVAIKYTPSQDYTLGKIEVYTGSNKLWRFKEPGAYLFTQIREDDEGRPSSTILSEVTTHIKTGTTQTVDENGNYLRWQGDFLQSPVNLDKDKVYWIIIWNKYSQYFSPPLAKEPNEKIAFYQCDDAESWVKYEKPYAWMIKLHDDEARPIDQKAPAPPIIEGPNECDTGEEYSDFEYSYSIDIPDSYTNTYYLIDWGDGTDTGWKEYYSGVIENKIWKKSGIFSITVKAKKIRYLSFYGEDGEKNIYMGEWSEPFNVEVTSIYGRVLPFFYRLINIFPNLARFVQFLMI